MVWLLFYVLVEYQVLSSMPKVCQDVCLFSMGLRFNLLPSVMFTLNLSPFSHKPLWKTGRLLSVCSLYRLEAGSFFCGLCFSKRMDSFASIYFDYSVIY